MNICLMLLAVTKPKRRSFRDRSNCAAWFHQYHHFDMSFRAVEELLFERGVLLSYETVRRWCLEFGSEYARRLKRRRARPGDKWHLDEVFLNIGGERRYLWRAVDQTGNTLDILVTSKRDKHSAKRFLRKLLRDNAKPRVIVTDKLRSYGAALKDLLPHTEHRQSRHLNSHAENSHQRTRRRERALQRFSPVTPSTSCPFSNLSTPASAHLAICSEHMITGKLCRSGS